MKDAIRALVEYVAGQGKELATSDLTETFERVNVTGVPLVDVAAALRLARPLVDQGGTVTLTFADEDATASLVSVGMDAWRVDGPPGIFSEDLARQEPRGTWSTDELIGFTPRSLDEATCNLVLDKQRWSEPLADTTGRQVWVGVTGAAFAAWVGRSTWEGAARVLLAESAALVLLDDWTNGVVTAGERMTVGDLDARAMAVPPGTPWPEPAEPSIVRAIEVEAPPETSSFPDGDVKRALAGMAAAAAAWSLAEVRDGDAQHGLRLRPSRVGTTTWTVPRDVRVDHTEIPVVQLARWVSKDANATRLAVARQVAAERIPDPFDVSAKTPAVTAADIAYQSAISAHVQSALRAQVDLERSFHEVDAKVAAIRDDLRDAVDHAVVRSLSAALAIAVASLTVAAARGWPTVVAAGVVAAYVLFTAWWVLQTMRTDLTSRFTSLGDVIKDRELGLGDTATKAIGTWKTGLEKRLWWAQVSLTTLAVLIAAAGVVLGSTLHRSGTSSNQPTPTVSSSPSPTRSPTPVPPSPSVSHTPTP